MRIGVYFPGLAKELGGGHTFEEEILGALGRLQSAGSTRHQFVAFRDGALPRDCPLEQVSLRPLRLNSLGAKLRQCYREVMLPLVRQRPLPGMRDPVERLLHRHGVEVMYYPTERPLTLERPFFITVWDLQHRLQPYFPEVSAHGAWQARETKFGQSLRRAAGVITGTQAGKAEIERFFQIAPERIRLLPHPTPSFALRPPPVDVAAVLARHGVRPPYLFYPGQFWAHKNHVGLLKALHGLRTAHGLPLTAVFVGSDQGNQAHVRAVAAELGLTAAVHFLGFVSREDLVALYRGAFALLYLTYFGPENLPPLEAFALGCPVVASDVPGSEEQLGDAAVRVKPGDGAAVIQAVKALYDEPARRTELIERGKLRAYRFTGDDFARRLLEAFDEFATLRRCWGAA